MSVDTAAQHTYLTLVMKWQLYQHFDMTTLRVYSICAFATKPKKIKLNIYFK